MSNYIGLARRYRPQTFEEVVGQQHVTSVITSAIRLKRIVPAYLLAGPRGTGKTTIARVLAKSLNCEKGPIDRPCGTCDACREIASGNSIDMIEIDGASNNGIDQIRELREQVRFAPVKGRYKTYIIDEVHMLSTSAFNGLLKTLEEPPPYTVFILATTEPQKIPVTITSRCQRYQLKRLGAPVIVAQLQHVIQQEKVDVEPAVLPFIANQAEGALRDALSLLDQLLGLGKSPVTLQDAMGLLGVMSHEAVATLIQAALEGRVQEALERLDDLINQGFDLHQIGKAWLTHARYLMLSRLCQQPQKFIPLPGDQVAGFVKMASGLSVDTLVKAVGVIRESESQMRYATQPRLVLETALARLSLCAQAPSAPAPVASSAPAMKPVVSTPSVMPRSNVPQASSVPPAKPSTVPSPVAKSALPPSNPAPRIPSQVVTPHPAPHTPSQVVTPHPAPHIPNSKDVSSSTPNPAPHTPHLKDLPGEPALTIRDLDDATKDGKLHELWPEVVAAVRARSMAIYGLLSDSRLISGDAGSILVEVGAEYHKTSLEKMDVRRVVEDVVSEKFRKPYRLKWQVRPKGQNAPEPVSSTPHSAPRTPNQGVAQNSAFRPPQSEHSDPSVQLGMKVFRGRVVPPGEKRR